MNDVWGRRIASVTHAESTRGSIFFFWRLTSAVLGIMCIVFATPRAFRILWTRVWLCINEQFCGKHVTGWWSLVFYLRILGFWSWMRVFSGGLTFLHNIPLILMYFKSAQSIVVLFTLRWGRRGVQVETIFVFSTNNFWTFLDKWLEIRRKSFVILFSVGKSIRNAADVEFDKGKYYLHQFYVQVLLFSQIN